MILKGKILIKMYFLFIYSKYISNDQGNCIVTTAIIY